MEKETRQRLERLTQQARRLLEQEFREQLEGRYDILLDGRIPLAPGAHLSPRERVLWDKLVAAIAHKRSQGITAAAAVAAYLREAAFHTLNRFVALKMLEARKLVQECISRGEDSAGFKEFIALAPGLVALPDKGYRLYVETIFDEIAQEVRALFDRRDAATLLWPRRQALLDLLAALNDPEVASVWGEDETIGWVYQYFNGEDERRQMRAESQAPRNSRELAVRNQFFTPRYVVQFLTDNSLGRTWCEMRGAETQLAHLDYLVKPEEGFEERAPKDPRDLRVLDPACGSGHFLLYAFDLLAGDPTRSFFGIYEEAWRAEAAPKSEVTGRTLKEDYASERALRRAVPELVLKHNLHGVDIDPRAAQIAGLALWMRAQRAYNDHKVAAHDRPLIGRTNIVTAEPMPGDRSLVAEFAATLRPQVLGELFQKMVEEMRLAGELGSLLKIDRALQSAVAKAREQFVREQREPQKFLPGLERPRKPQLEFDLSGVSDESFFDSAEERIVQALQEYAAGAPASMSIRRQLFADDAAQGIAFIDLCRKRFDVVLMNPPFGAASLAAKKEFESAYPRTKNDVYAAFVERGIELLHPTGYLGAITSSTYFNLATFGDLRERLLSEWAARVLVDLGGGVMDDAAVSAACAVIENMPSEEKAEVVFFDLRFVSDRPETLRCGILDGTSHEVTKVPAASLRRLPDHMFAYWLPRGVQRVFAECDELGQHGVATFGLHCRGADERFYRAWWEVPAIELGSHAWPSVFLGGKPQHFFRDTYYVVDWRADARALREVASRASGGTFTGRDHYFKPGLTYIYTAQTTFSVQPLPAASVFTAAAHGLFAPDADRLIWLAWLNSEPVRLLTKVINPHRFFQASYVRRIPRPDLSTYRSELASLSKEALRLSIEHVAGDECSRHYGGDWTSTAGSKTGSPFDLAVRRAGEIAVSLRGIRERINQIVQRAYGLSSEDLDAMSARIGASTAQALPGSVDLLAGGKETAAREHCSAMFGAAIGRWSAADFESRSVVDDEYPFSPLGAPNVLQPVGIGGGILVDDEGHPDDVVARVEAALLAVWSDSYARIVDELANLLGADLRGWFRRDFWSYHVARYSFSQAKAPIYWQLATASGSYSVWIYIHRATGDTLFRVLNDFVGPKLDHEKAKLEGLTKEAGGNPSAAQRREIEQQETFVGELQALKTEVARVAPLWKPNLDDGVILNFAPLWRLVPQSRSWQGECKKAWDKLVAGDYDWAHLAMHLWPERVVPKCIDDRSLAIAHGLEEVFWHEDDSGTWRKSRVDDATVQKLVQERTSTTVKAALKDLLSAATPTASKGRKARGRGASRRGAAPKPTPAPARDTAPDTVVDEATLRAVKAAIASVADGASKADVLAVTDLSDSDWNKAIAALLDRGDVTRTGQRRGTRYHANQGDEE